MTAESEAFEQLNARIQRLLHAKTARVTWNATIADPDDLGKMRQIDVLIEEGGRRTGVECRDRSAGQSVMWVEELIGRKRSLALDAMIGVAVNGFTPHAQTKANRYGIVLYDFRTLSDAEIASWTGAATVDATFIQFAPLIISAGIAQADFNQLGPNPTFRHEGIDGFCAVMDRVRDDVASNAGLERHTKLAPTGFEVAGFPLKFLLAGYIGELVSTAAACTAVQAVGHPGTEGLLRDVTVQRFDHTVPQVIRKGNDIHLVLDVSALKPPPDSILHEMNVKFASVATLARYELIGNRTMWTKGKFTMLQMIPI